MPGMGWGLSDLGLSRAVHRPSRCPHPCRDPVVLAAGINSATEHDHLPFIARTGSELSLVWVRYDTRDANSITNPQSDLYLATSADGLSWSTPRKVTTDPAGQNLFPQIYQRHDGTWSLLWLSTRTGSPLLYEIPLAGASRFPTGVVENTLLPPGYSHRMTRTATPNEYLAAWVQGPDGSQDIYYRFHEVIDVRMSSHVSGRRYDRNRASPALLF